MDLNYQQFIPDTFSDDAKVWIYQASRLLTPAESLQLEDKIIDFVASWNTHGTPNKSIVRFFFGQFLVIMADEATQKVSGCSIDASVAFVKSIEKQFNVAMFNRTNLAFVLKNKVQIIPMEQLKYAYDNGFIQQDSLYFNNLVATKKAFLTEWIVPVKNSWLMQKLQ